MPNARRKPARSTIIALGRNVQRLRKAKGLTQEALSELVDVHPRMIQKLEAGETNILATTAIRLVRALGCKWDELMPTD